MGPIAPNPSRSNPSAPVCPRVTKKHAPKSGNLLKARPADPQNIWKSEKPRENLRIELVENKTTSWPNSQIPQILHHEPDASSPAAQAPQKTRPALTRHPLIRNGQPLLSTAQITQEYPGCTWVLPGQTPKIPDLGSFLFLVQYRQAVAPAFFNPVPAPLNQFSNIPRLARGNTVTFRWSAGFNLTGYRIQLGYGTGSSEFHDQTTNNLYSDPVTVPSNLVATTQVYVTLTGYNGSTAVTSTTGKYEVWFEQVAATMSAPAPGSTLTSSSVIFSWSNGSSSQRRLAVGTLGPGSSNILAPTSTSDTLMMVSGLPTDGRPVYVTLESLFPSTMQGWQFAKHYTYNATGTPPGGGSPGTVPGTVTLSSAGPIPVFRGSNALASINVTPANGFSGPVQVSCSSTIGVTCRLATTGVSSAARTLPVLIEASPTANVGYGLMVTISAVAGGGTAPVPIQAVVDVLSNAGFQRSSAGGQTINIPASGDTFRAIYSVRLGDNLACGAGPDVTCTTANLGSRSIPCVLGTCTVTDWEVRLTASASATRGERNLSTSWSPLSGGACPCSMNERLVIYDPTPEITSVSPELLPAATTTRVTITGRNLGLNVSVRTTPLEPNGAAW